MSPLPLLRAGDLKEGPSWPRLPDFGQQLARKLAEGMRPKEWWTRNWLLTRALQREQYRDVMLDCAVADMARSHSLLITASLEFLGEGSVSDPEAALWYALTEHSQWRRQGREILEPLTRLPAHPGFDRIAALVRTRHRDVPAPLCGNAALQYGGRKLQ
jgi:hypothetical protein